MHFCKKCDNMYYIKLDNTEQELIHYCRHCGFEDTELSTKKLSVSKIQVKGNVDSFSNYINEFTKLDPTIPRINSIPCPNAECPCNNSDPEKRVERDILYVRYNDDELKYIYMCSHCDTTWKSNEN